MSGWLELGKLSFITNAEASGRDRSGGDCEFTCSNALFAQMCYNICNKLFVMPCTSMHLACIAVLVSFHGVHVYVYLYLKESIVLRRHPVDATRSLFAFRLM